MSRSPRSPFVMIVIGAVGAGCGSSSSDGVPGVDSGVDANGDTVGDVSMVDGDVTGADTSTSENGDGSLDDGDTAPCKDAVGDADPPANPAECPTEHPGFGDVHKPCSAPPSVRCAYRDPCPQRPTCIDPFDVYVCHDLGAGATWVLVSDDYSVHDCPSSIPRVGDPCPCAPHRGFAGCSYGKCPSVTYASCRVTDVVQKTWQTSPVCCNPPEPDAGPDAVVDTRPVDDGCVIEAAPTG